MRDASTSPAHLLERLDQVRVTFELLGNPEVLGRLGRFVVFAGAGGMGVIQSTPFHRTPEPSIARMLDLATIACSRAAPTRWEGA